MLLAVLLVILVTLLLAFQQPGLGVLFAIAMGFVQDPLRKITPEQPPWMVTLSAVVLAVAFVGTLAKGGRPQFPTPDLRRAGTAFLFIVALQSLIAVAKGRSPLVTLVGAASYALPLVAAWMGMVYGRRPSRVLRLFLLYVALGTVAGLTVFLAVAGFDPPVFRPLGQLLVYGRGAQELPSGVLRAPEIASWHAGISACLAVVLGVRRRPSLWSSAAIGALVGLLTVAVFLTGRRKGLVLIALFFLFFLWLSRVGGGARGLGGWIGVVLAMGAVTLSVLLQAHALDDKEDLVDTLMMRNQELGTHTRQRAVGLFGSVPLMIRAAGVMGAGVGALAQGSQYLGGAAEAGVVSESGPARILGELGVPGAVVFIWLVISYVRLVAKGIPRLRSLPQEGRILASGTAAVLCTAAMVFLSAHQIFGDPFVYVFLGLASGILIGLIRSASDLATSASAGPGSESRKEVRWAASGA